MKHIIMIESWIGGAGRLLPAKIRERGYTYTFVTRKLEHYFASSNDIMHPVIKYATNIITTETNDIDNLIKFLLNQHKALHFDGIITVCDYYIDTVAKVAAALNLPMPFFDQVSSIRQKHLLREAISKTGLPNPEFKIVRSWETARKAASIIGYPLVIKPSDLASSAHVQLVQNEDELHKAFAIIDDFKLNFREQPRERLCLLESFMDGSEFSVETCTVNGETTVIGVTDKSILGEPFFIEDGHMFPADISKDEEKEITHLVKNVLKKVGYKHGIAHTEVKLTSQGAMIVEINPRPGGNYITELVERVTGIDLIDVQLDLAIGDKPDLTVKDKGVKSAAIKFLVPTADGVITNLNSSDTLSNNPKVARSSISSKPGEYVKAAIDNACYLGHVVAVDTEGLKAREYAEKALLSLDLQIKSKSVFAL